MADSIETGEFVFTAEQAELRSAVRGFCSEQSGEDQVRRLMGSPGRVDRGAWRRLGAELGVLGLGVPEDVGGSGGGLVDAAIVLEELGSVLYCGPVLGTLMTSIPALVAAPASDTRSEILAPLVEGVRTAAFAVSYGVVDGVRPPTVRAECRAGEWTVRGTAARVVDAGAADDLIVAATGLDGAALYVVDAAAPGVHRTGLTTLDLTRPQATVVFDGAPARLLVGPEDTPAVCRRAFAAAGVLLAAEQVGGGRHMLALSTEHAQGRLQFGRPIGSFQAVKHRLVDMLVEQQHARSAAYHGAWAVQDGTDDPELAASIAQAVCSDAFRAIAAAAVQVFGGIGFTWEHSAHLYFKRAVADAALLGGAEVHRDAIARAVLDRAVAGEGIAVASG